MTDTVLRPDFASDKTAGICPEALSALLAANAGRMASYGNDEITRRACDRIRALFDTDCDVFFVFNGTAANALALATLCQSYHGIVCHELAHVEADEFPGCTGGSRHRRKSSVSLFCPDATGPSIR